MGILNTLPFIARHPLNRGEKVRAIKRFINWQISSRIVKAPIAMPFVNQTRLLASASMTGATGNIYAGLHEVEEMALTLHLLRLDDDFIDIGANIGSYTLLAAGVVGARSVSIEPIPSTYEKLLDNIYLNRLHNHVKPLNIGLGEKKTIIQFSLDQDTTNHVLGDTETLEGINVPVECLDEVTSDYEPILIKIDVEGFEYPVLRGGLQSLRKPTLLAAIIETNGSGRNYGYSDQQVDELMREHGFTATRYEPFLRKFSLLPEGQWHHGNTVYVRNLPEVQARVKTAPTFQLGTGATL